MHASSQQQTFIQDYALGDIIFEEGQRGSDMFVVLSGAVDLYRRHGQNGSSRLASLAQGEMFGEMALITEGPRMASARASAPGTRLIRIDQARFVYLTSQQPAFALSVMRVLAQRLAKTSQD